jgi:hypothetical protein
VHGIIRAELLRANVAITFIVVFKSEADLRRSSQSITMGLKDGSTATGFGTATSAKQRAVQRAAYATQPGCGPCPDHMEGAPIPWPYDPDRCRALGSNCRQLRG